METKQKDEVFGLNREKPFQKTISTTKSQVDEKFDPFTLGDKFDTMNGPVVKSNIVQEWMKTPDQVINGIIGPDRLKYVYKVPEQKDELQLQEERIKNNINASIQLKRSI